MKSIKHYLLFATVSMLPLLSSALTVDCPLAVQSSSYKTAFKFVQTNVGLQIWENNVLKITAKDGSIKVSGDKNTIEIDSRYAYTDVTLRQSNRMGKTSYSNTKQVYVLDDGYSYLDCQLLK